MAQERQTQTSRTTWQHYTKAGAIFVATTATYLLARTTGALDSLWRWNEGDGAANDQAGETLQSAVARVVEPVGTEVATIATQGEHRMNLDLAVTPVATTQTTPNFSVTDWSEREFPSIDLQAATTLEASSRNSDELETEILDIPSTATARRLLQTVSGVTVANSIPDQVIEATLEYIYDISNVFSGNYTSLRASQTNGSSLPAWLSIKFAPFSCYDTPDSAISVQVQNSIAYVADGFSGLQVLNVSNPLNVTRLGGYRTPSSAISVQVQNGIAYVADGGSGLQVLNVSNPQNIFRLGSYDTPDNAKDVQVQNGLAYVADYSSGLQILNITNPRNITRLGNYDTPSAAFSVQVINGIAYVADLASLQVLNVTTPANITFLGSYAASSGVQSLQVVDSIAYVTGSLTGLLVLNVSNPTNISRIGSYRTPGFGSDVQVLNGLAYVADDFSGLQILDVSNPNNVTLLGSYDTSGRAKAVHVQNEVAYVADDTSGLQLVSLSKGLLSGTPTAARIGEQTVIRLSAWQENSLIAYEDFVLTVARLPQRVDTSLLDRSIRPKQTLSILLDADVLFADPSTSTLTLDAQLAPLTAAAKQLTSIVLSLNPTSLNSYDTPGQAYGVHVQNEVAYMADGTSGLQVLNVSNPLNVTRLGGYDTPGFANDVQVQNNVVYVADGFSGLQILDVSNPRNITRIGSYDTPGTAYAVQVLNGLAYVADYAAGLQVLNVTNPGNITYLGSYNTSSSSSYDIQVQDGLAYLVDFVFPNSGLQVLNISNPRNIIRLGSYGLSSAINLQVQNGIAYVAANNMGLYILNVSSPANITKLGSYQTLGQVQSVQVINCIAYIADYQSGLQVLNVTNPLNVTWLAGYVLPDWAQGVQVQNGLAYMADHSAGLQILDLTQWQFTVTPTFAQVGNYRVTITATNELGGTASDSFELRVEGGPQLNPNITIPQLFAKVGVPFNYFIPQGLLSDPNNDPISFTALSADNSTLPSWLSFNGISATFSGLAQSSNVGNYSLRIIATDNVPGTIDAHKIFNLYVDHLPYVNQRISDQVAGVGLPYNFTVPSSTIIDPDNGDVLSYSSRQRDGSALPAWLKFNATSRRFFGTPNQLNNGSYSLVLSASDTHNGTVQTDFNLLVEHFPVANLNQTIIAPVAGVGQPWSMSLPTDSFIDEDDTQLTYRMTRSDGASLPSWLSFNPFSGALLGVPQSTEVGVNSVRVFASDPHGGTAYRDFNFTVMYFPSVANAIPKPAPSRILRPFNFTVPRQTFSDLDSPVLIYNATLSDSQPLPTWLNFDAQNLVLSGTPNASDADTFNLLIQAQDNSGGSIGAPLEVVIQPNFPPQLSTQISNQVASVLQPFNFYVPTGTFRDGNGDALNYSARLMGGGHFPAWLKFDATTLHFYGTPQRSDTGDFSERVLNIELTAADDLSQTSTNFKINVQGNSNLALSLKIGGPFLTAAGLAFGLYKKRSLLINRYQKEKYQKLDHTAVIGEEFFYPLETPPAEVKTVQAKLIAPPARYCLSVASFFTSKYDRLPGHLKLPNWLMYDTESNTLRSKGPVPTVKYKELIIQVKDEADVTREEFVLKVRPAQALAETADQQQTSHVSIEVGDSKHSLQAGEGLADRVTVNQSANAHSSNQFGFLSSSRSVLRNDVSSPALGKKARVEEITENEMELTALSPMENTH